jgi:hypothetical protein
MQMQHNTGQTLVLLRLTAGKLKNLIQTGDNMTTQMQDTRALLAKMEAEETAARAKADTLASENAKKREELLAQLRAADLDDVIAKCKMHGFTATDLRSALKVKAGGRKAVPRKSATRKTTRRRSTKTA